MLSLIVFGILMAIIGLVIVIVAMLCGLIGFVGTTIGAISTVVCVAFCMYLVWKVAQSIYNDIMKKK